MKNQNEKSRRALLQKKADNVRIPLAKANSIVNAFEKKDKRLDVLLARLTTEKGRSRPNVRLVSDFQTEIELLRQQISDEALESELAPYLAQIKTRLGEVVDCLRIFLTVEKENLLTQISDVLKPFVRDEIVRRRIAFDVDSMRVLQGLASCHWFPLHASDAPIVCAETVLAEIDGLIAGRKPWLDL